jgi:hypothetical protein
LSVVKGLEMNGVAHFEFYTVRHCKNQFQFPLPEARHLFVPTRGIEYKKKKNKKKNKKKKKKKKKKKIIIKTIATND